MRLFAAVNVIKAAVIFPLYCKQIIRYDPANRPIDNTTVTVILGW